VDKRISAGENLALELTFTPDELDEVLSSMKQDTAPGPDGLPVAFFKHLWGSLKGPILRLVNDFVLGRVDISRLNFGIISLIPKVKCADSIKKFRPIALINVIFKFVTKAYAIRLSPLAHRTIDRSQTAFIKGRCLHEGVVALHEIVHELRSKKLRGLLLKLDFEKAYDRVNWDFLREVLTRKGFYAMLVHRLMRLVSGGQTAINVNGEISPFFRNTRGVRQGDPLSPILFDFMVEALAAMLSRANESHHIQGWFNTSFPEE
jgi:mannosylglycoprotein endo-beta-mannosidase